MPSKRMKIADHHSSGRKQESGAQSQSMTFVNKPDSAADNLADEVSASLGLTEGRKSGGKLVNRSSVDKLLSRAIKLGHTDTESTSYQELKQRLK